MINHATSEFWNRLAELPQTIQDLAHKQFQLFHQSPRHPSLQFKRLSNTRNDIWSARVNDNYRVLAVRTKDGQGQDVLLWFWIGTHRDYEKLASRL